ncbi:hypothetical protein NC652_033886 [Populus alba x Populus x berolinensis]|nr:hypothetical protein NC652_033886 [Populus alba x Populus x berolinensis]
MWLQWLVSVWRSQLILFHYIRENGLVFTVAMLDVN